MTKVQYELTSRDLKSPSLFSITSFNLISFRKSEVGWRTCLLCLRLTFIYLGPSVHFYVQY